MIARAALRRHSNVPLCAAARPVEAAVRCGCMICCDSEIDLHSGISHAIGHARRTADAKVIRPAFGLRSGTPMVAHAMVFPSVTRSDLMETMERDADYIASQCKFLRKMLSLTQENLADTAGLTIRTIQKVESRRHVPDVQTLRSIARGVGFPPSSPPDHNTHRRSPPPTGTAAVVEITPEAFPPAPNQ